MLLPRFPFLVFLVLVCLPNNPGAARSKTSSFLIPAFLMTAAVVSAVTTEQPILRRRLEEEPQPQMQSESLYLYQMEQPIDTSTDIDIDTVTGNAYVTEFIPTHDEDFQERILTTLPKNIATSYRIVEYYSPHCPACVEFKPEYMELARLVNQLLIHIQPSSASPIEVQFYALSCDAHPLICDEMNIHDTPTLMAYGKIHASHQGVDGTDPSLITLEGVPVQNHTVEAILEALGLEDFLHVNRNDNDKYPPIIHLKDENRIKGGEVILNPQTNDDDISVDNSDQTDHPFEPHNNVVSSNDDNDESKEDDDNVVASLVEDDDNDQARISSNEDVDDDDDDDDDNNYDHTDQIGGIGKYSEQLPPFAMSAIQEGGYQKAKDLPKALNRFQDRLQTERQEHEKKYNQKHHQKKFFRQKHGELMLPSSNAMEKDPDSMTPGMKVWQPDTVEYRAHQDLIQKRMNRGYKTKGRQPTSQVLQSYHPYVHDNLSLPYRKEVRKPSLARNVASKIPIVGKRYTMSSEEELILDVSLSIISALKSGVHFQGGSELAYDDKARLKRFLDLLSFSLPMEWGIHRFLRSLRLNLNEVTKNGSVWRQSLSSYPLANNGVWSQSCINLDRGTLGLTCGFWKLLHVITIGIAEQQGGLNIIDSSLMERNIIQFSPMEVADTIRDYIDSFFFCAPCKKHFVETYDNCENHRRCDRLKSHKASNRSPPSTADWKELGLWMWEFHNEVSIRIHREQQARMHAGIQNVDTTSDIVAIWPNIETCFLCFNMDGTWNEVEVFNFLEKSYWPDAEPDPLSELLIQYDGSDEKRTSVALWLLSFFVLATVYGLIKSTSPAPVQYQLLRAKRIVMDGTVKKRQQ